MYPNLAGLVAAYQQHLSPAGLLDDVAWISSVDRLQGSTGLDRLATGVASRASEAGLVVDHRRYRPGTRWWDFTAPQAASPVAAAIDLVQPAERITSYPEQAFSLARGSASLRAAEVRIAVLGDDPVGALVICPPQPRFALTRLIEALHQRGARAIAVESPRGSFDDHVVARLEVPDDCPLTVFAVSAAQASRLRAAKGTRARVHAEHDPPAPMPVVHAHHQGQAGRPRGLLIAHLCHPAPSANDNASGSAALLAIGDALTRLWPTGTGPAIDLLWGPEMVGTAAYLHDLDPAMRPDFVLSLDMIGAPGHPILEDSPDHCPAPLTAAIEAAARHISPSPRSYSGAVELPTWPRVVTPFVGASDHLLFADRSIAIPAAHLTCGPDAAHHTSYDTTDRIQPATLTNTTIAAAAAASALCLGGPALDDITTAHRDMLRHRIAVEPDHPDAVAHRRAVAATGLETMHAWHDNTRRDRPSNPNLSTPAPTDVVSRRWSGPWNLHNLLTAAGPAQQDQLADLLTDSGPGYARLTGLALAIDDHSGPAALASTARRATGLHISRIEADRFLTVMRETGWIAGGTA